MAGLVKITGAKEIEKILKLIPHRIQERVILNSVKAGARVVRDEAKRRVPVRTGVLRDSIVVRKGFYQPRHGALAIVGVKWPASPLAHLIEFGTAHSRPQPYMGPAADAVWLEAIDAAGKNIGRGVEREALKLAGEYPTRRR